MAKFITLSQELIDEVRRDFEESLRNLKLSDGKISFTKSFNTIQRKATVYFTEIAWQKMMALVRGFDKEVAWHGVAFRGDDPEKDEYTITDILVYPQEVTGATVTTDQVKYQDWLMQHDDDVFNNIRMQGHSHVNMSTSPSTVDTTLYERILDQLEEDMFYIFLIYNKRGECTYKIYDLAKNVLFETSDVSVKILGEGFDMDAFMADAKEKVQTRVTQYSVPTYQSGKPLTSYGSQPAYQAVSNKQAASAPASQKKEEEKKSQKTLSLLEHSKKKKLEKGKKEGKIVGGYSVGMKSGGSMYDDDDIYGEGPYGAFGWRDNWY